MNVRIPKVSLSRAEREAIHREIDQQTANNVKNLSQNLSAIIMWELHTQLGFGKKRLLRFIKAFRPLLKELQDYYEMRSAEDTEFLYKYRLKSDVGIDVEELDDIVEFQVVMGE